MANPEQNEYKRRPIWPFAISIFIILMILVFWPIWFDDSAPQPPLQEINDTLVAFPEEIIDFIVWTESAAANEQRENFQEHTAVGLKKLGAGVAALYPEGDNQATRRRNRIFGIAGYITTNNSTSATDSLNLAAGIIFSMLEEHETGITRQIFQVSPSQVQSFFDSSKTIAEQQQEVLDFFEDSAAALELLVTKK
jgi:hypothetical protein